MAPQLRHVSTLSDGALTTEVTRLAGEERHATAALVAALAEFDARRLYLPAGCASLFTYCRQVLHLSEHAAYTRIEAARAARRFPAILERLASGDLTLTAVRLLAPHLTPGNWLDLFDRARHLSKRDVEALVAALRPQPDAPSVMRKLPATGVAPDASVPTAAPLLVDDAEGEVTAATDAAAAPRSPQSSPAGPQVTPHLRESPSRARAAVIAPLAPERYKVQFTVSREVHDQLRHAQDLLRHAIPNGDPAAIFARALALLRTWSGGSWRRCSGRGIRERTCRRPPLPPGTFRRRSGVRSGHAMKVAARSSGRQGGAPSVGSWSFITWCRSPTVGRRPPRIWSCDAAGTISSRWSGGVGVSHSR
jgi:hypothetical protein